MNKQDLQNAKSRISSELSKLDDLPSEDDVDEDEIESERQRLKDQRWRIDQYLQDRFNGGDADA